MISGNFQKRWVGYILRYVGLVKEVEGRMEGK